MSTTATSLPTGTWTGDPVHSTATFRVKYMGVSTFKAGFDSFEATYDGASGRLEGRAAVEGIQIRTPDQFRQHVLGADFFDAATHPEITFVSTAITPGAGDQVEVEGELTIKGITKPVVARGTVTEPVDGPWGGRKFSLNLSTTVDRREFGLDWQQPMPKGGDMLANDVTLDIELLLAADEA